MIRKITSSLLSEGVEVSGPLMTGTWPLSEVETVDVYHELGLYPEDHTIERLVDINPLAPPKAVLVKSHVTGRGTRGLSSPAYLATIRRRFAAKVLRLVAALDRYAESENFAVWTHQVLESLRESIQTLSVAEESSTPEHEANSCEILRQIRDTLLDDGWKRYREPQVRAAVVKILQQLSAADDVTADNAFGAMDRLLDLDLNPSVGMAWEDGQRQEVPD